MARLFDHVDLRVSDLARAGPFYRVLLPALGFAAKVEVEGWLQFEGPGGPAAEFFGLVEDASHRPNANRIAFWAESNARVDELAAMLARIGARNIDGPGFEADFYYAVYFDDPCGNRLEICHRSRRFNEGQPP